MLPAVLGHGKMPPPLVSLLRAVVVTPFASPGDLASLSAVLLGPPAWELQTHCHSTETLLQACPVPESRGRLCCGCWTPAPGSLSPATHPQARPRPNLLATGWRWLSLGREGFFANLLLNHSTSHASIRLSGAKCTAIHTWVLPESLGQ